MFDPVFARLSGSFCRLAFIVATAAFTDSAAADPPPTSTTTLPGECGNGEVEGVEDCDLGGATAVLGQPCTAACRVRRCGKPAGTFNAKPLVSDALFALRSSVGTTSCALCLCDVDRSGKVSATDALKILRYAVGQKVTLDCQSCVPLRRRASFLVSEKFAIPLEAREGVLAEREHIETAGVVLAEDGSVVTWPPRGAAGWWLRFGEAFSVTDEDGNVEIAIPEGERTGGTIAHPQESDTALFAVSAYDLVPLDTDPAPFLFEREFFGPCGMNADKDFPDPSVCSELAPPVSALIGPVPAMAAASADGSNVDGAPAHIHHGSHAMALSESVPFDGGAAGQFGNTEPPLTTAARGTYPAGGQRCCKDYDGGTYDGGTLSGTILNYYGSTCQKYVSSGCCGGELGSLKNSALSAVGLLKPVACQKNHDGRYCQELKEGDVSVDIAGAITAAGGSTAPALIELGESRAFVVHNNGCFGDTSVERFQAEISGVLTGTGYDGASKIDHASTGTYAPDVGLTFTTPRCVGALTSYARDHYRFGVDGGFVDVWFVMSPTGLYRFVPDGPVFSVLASNKYSFQVAGTDQCDALHVHGQHPCTGAPEPVGAGPCGHGKVVAYTPPARN